MKLVRPLLKGLFIFGLAVLFAYWMLWMCLLGPIGYSAPERFEYTETSYQVFAYGTLKHPWVRRFILGRSVEVTVDQLTGYERQGLDLREDAEAVTVGVRFWVDATEMQRLDRYEQLGVRYRREEVVLASGSHAWVYRRLIVD